MAKVIYNKTLYYLRQHYFETHQLLSHFILLNLLKKDKSYYLLNSYSAICIINDVFKKFQDFYFKQLKASQQIKIPRYINVNYLCSFVIKNTICKIDNKNYIPLKLDNEQLLKELNYHIPTLSNLLIPIPVDISTKQIVFFKINPLYRNYWFNILIVFKSSSVVEPIVNHIRSETLAIDLGINNLVTAVSTNLNSFIIDGRFIKSINHLYNKKLAEFSKKRIDQKQISKKMFFLTNARNKRVNDYLHKSSRYIINFAIKNNISKIVVGYNERFKHLLLTSKSISHDTIFNQNFSFTPLSKLKSQIKYLCLYSHITFIEIDESYTSKCSFYDNEKICFHAEYKGKRIYRGLFKTNTNQLVNADVNAALNILKKSKTNSDEILNHLRNSGNLVPKRIFINKNYKNKL